MADYRSMFDRDYIGAWDLEGREVTVRISKVMATEVIAPGNKKNKRPVISFEGREKKFVVNSTNGKTIAGMYGRETAQWVGKWITLFPTTAPLGKETVDAIRVRPTIPPGKGDGSAQPRRQSDEGASS